LNRKHENAHAEGRPIVCDLAAHGAVRVPLAAVGELRRQPGPAGVASLPTNFLKHSDEQTVVGLSAILHAIANHGLRGQGFADWGVLAAPRFLARSTMITSLQRFQAEGAWGVSPHMIPHRSLHSLSGTVSHALQMRGPNFGVGGGHSGAVEVLPTAVSLVECGQVPGVWVVWTAQEPDGAMDLAGQCDPGTICRAFAVALTPPKIGSNVPQLSLEVRRHAMSEPTRFKDYFYLETLLNLLHAAQEPGRTVIQDLDAGFRVALAASDRLHGKPAAVAASPVQVFPAFSALPPAEIKP
jgi:hypothetical protein